MVWQPVAAHELGTLISDAVDRMDVGQRLLWQAIRVKPHKWKQHPYGDEGGGFWVVAVLGHTVIWYNDIEEGFNRSSWTDYGILEEYCCNHDQLEWTIQDMIDFTATGQFKRGRLGPPQPVPPLT